MSRTIYLYMGGSVYMCWRIHTCTRERMRAHAPKNMSPKEKNKKERSIKKEINKESSYNYINILILVYPHKNERSE